MRTWGRTYKEDGTWKWQQVSTAANGDNSAVYATTLIQCLKLQLGESPFYGNYGIPAQRSVVTQIFPTYYVFQTQAQFAPYFSSLLVTQDGTFPPVYTIQAVTFNGAIINVPVPT